MGTHAVITFRDGFDSYHVFKHFDGDPVGVADALTTMQNSGKVWELPRFEADEAAAGFIAANKTKEGDFRLCKDPSQYGDLEYYYEVFQADNGQLIIRASTVRNHKGQWNLDHFFYGRVKEFIADAAGMTA